MTRGNFRPVSSRQQRDPSPATRLGRPDVGYGPASAEAAVATGSDKFDTAVAGLVSGGAEYATGNPRLANLVSLGFTKTLGSVVKSVEKKIGQTFAKEESKNVCQSKNNGQKC